MNTVDDVGRLIAGAVEGAEAIAAAASNLARDRSLSRCHQLGDQARAFLHGTERLKRAMIDANGGPADA